MDIVVNRNSGIFEATLNAGLRLAALSESQGGWAEYFQQTDEADMRIEDPILKAQTALMLENAKQALATICRPRVNSEGIAVINETVRSALVGGFSDYLFPIIRAAFPTNAINELVSVQPTTRRHATIMFWNYSVGTTKGGYTAGQRIFDANVGRTDGGFSYTSEQIENEAVTVTRSGANGTASGNLAFYSGGGIRAGTVKFVTSLTTAGASQEFYDDGNGGWATVAAGVTISSGSINYKTGAFTIVITGDTFSANTAVATYSWDSEGSCDLPEMDINITTTTTEVQRRALKLNYTVEAMQDAMAEFGVAIEPELVSAGAEQLNFEVARQIIHELWLAAPVAASFPLTVGTGNYPQQQHFGDFIYTLNVTANNIWGRTQKAFANWAVVDQGAASMVESLPSNIWQPAPQPANVQGLHFIGTLAGRYRVYKDLLLHNEQGASSYGNILLGWKGRGIADAGFVYAPYQMFYTTDSIPDACFNIRKAMATRYATKMVNANMYARISLAA